MWEAEEVQSHFPLLYCLCRASCRGTGVLLRAWRLQRGPCTITPCDGNPQRVSGNLQGKGLSERSVCDSPGRWGEPSKGWSDTPTRALFPTCLCWSPLCPQMRKPEELCWQQPRRSVLWCLHALQTCLITSNSSEI